jgi:hypothetical protein
MGRKLASLAAVAAFGLVVAGSATAKTIHLGWTDWTPAP